MVRLGLVGAVLIAAAGCCTEIGCGDAMVWVLPSSFAPPVANETLSIRACVESSCVDGALQTAGEGFWASDEGSALFRGDQRTLQVRFPGAGGEQSVSLEVKKNDQVVLSDSRRVTFKTFTPNGPFCEPTCAGARIEL